MSSKIWIRRIKYSNLPFETLLNLEKEIIEKKNELFEELKKVRKSIYDDLENNSASNIEQKKSIEDAVKQLKQANGGSDINSIKTAIENLNKAWEPVSQKMYQAAQQEAQTPPNGADGNTDTNESSKGSSKEGEVEDADFEVVEEK